ncbi:MAG: bifunctional hydroxymethylpyrimidine kinase/phosphomethylpyrimidine kinase [Planctomycetes bacterium]|nr:bifunctional hydroxymethylpyrimidine kinase/phosphomethylpyrimidine kinase [Planctomycetota bacterium]
MTGAAPRVLSIAGLDPCGGAGLVADTRAIVALGGFALAVPTCTTVQNRHGFAGARATSPADLVAMLDAVAADGPLDAIKTGLFVDPATVAAVAAYVDRLPAGIPLVVDPVLSATAGGSSELLAQCAAALLRHLVPRATVVTPNLPELARLSAGDPQPLLDRGAQAVLVKGGHGAGDEAVDVLHLRTGAVERSVRPRLHRGPVHGTGCALSAALAALLASGADVPTAARTAGDLLARWLAATPHGRGALPEPLRIGASQESASVSAPPFPT